MMRPKERKTPLIVRVPNGVVKIAIVSDCHIGSKYQQITHLKDFYLKAQQAKVQAVLHSGDISDGFGLNMHKGMVHEQFIHTFTDMLDYLECEYPQINVKTYIIQGNHDTTFMKEGSGNLVKELAKKREDIVYVGDYQGVVRVGRLKVRLCHSLGAPAYALSYRLQKLVEGLSSENKPHILIQGHFHRSISLLVRNVFCLEGGCWQAQTPYMAGKALYPAIGGWIITIEQTKTGMGRIISEFVPYFKPIYRDY